MFHILAFETNYEENGRLFTTRKRDKYFKSLQFKEEIIRESKTKLFLSGFRP